MKNEIQASISLACDPNETIHHNIQNDHSLQAEESGGRGGSKRYFLIRGEKDSYLRGPLPLGLGAVECRHPIIHGLLLR